MRLLLKRILSVLPVFTVLLVILQVVVSNQMGILGRHLAIVEENIVREEDLQEILRTQVAQAVSLSAVENKAGELGFRRPEKDQVIHISSETLPVALGRVR